jgi:hypothetical protein
MPRNLLNVAWIRAFEVSIVVGCMCAAFIAGHILRWELATVPQIFIENPDPASHFAHNPHIHAGDILFTTRSVRRTDDCALDGGVWILNGYEKDIVMSIQTYTSYAPANASFKNQNVWTQIPSVLPVGHYWIRPYVSCQLNPILQSQQRLQDIEFWVVPPSAEVEKVIPRP